MKEGALSPVLSINLLTGKVLNTEVFSDRKYQMWLRRLKTNQYGVREKASVQCQLIVANNRRALNYSYTGPAVPLFSPKMRTWQTEFFPLDGELAWMFTDQTLVNSMFSDVGFLEWVELLDNPRVTTALQNDPMFLQFVDQVKLGQSRCYNEFYFPPGNPDMVSFATWWKASKDYLRSLSDYDSATVLQYQRASQLINLYVSSSREDIQSGKYLDSIKSLNMERARTAVSVQYYKLYPNLDLFQSHYFMFPHTHDVFSGAVLQDAKNPAVWITPCLDLMQRDLRRIIAGAPPTTTSFMVYRGLTKPFGTMSGVARHYSGFLSTSGDYNMSNDYFRDAYGNLLCINVPPGQQCLVLGAYKIQTECEVLFAPRTYLQIDRYDVSKSSLFQGKNPLFVSIIPETSLAGVKRERS